MRVKSVSVRNYRSLKDVTVCLDALTVIIGANGAGKTSILKAIDLFSADAPPVTSDDFNDGEKSIEVDLTISCEKADGTLAPYVIDGEIRLRRTYEPADPARANARPAQKNHIRTRRNVDLEGLGDMTRKADIKPAVAALKGQEIYAGLPECETTAREWAPMLRDYERDFCRRHPDHPSVRPGYVTWDMAALPPERLLDIVYVPAMRDITRDGAGASGSYLSRLISMAVEYSWYSDAKVAKAVKESVQAYEKYFVLVANRVIPQLAADLNKKSCRFARNTSVTIDIGEPPTSVPQPSPAITLNEDGHEADIERVGGGLQRVYLMALLETISEQRAKAPDRVPGSRARLVMIDEPEIYQHPQRQRAILHELGRLAGPKSDIQVMCSTHSPYFIEISRIEGLRILTKDRSTSVHATSRQEIAEDVLGSRHADLPRDVALDRWLDTNASHWITEGLFSRLAVLVEGIEDRHVLLAAASVLGVDLDAYDISIVPCHRKSKLPAIFRIFRRFEIPCYMVWDLDHEPDGEPKEQEALNSKLFALADPGNGGRPAEIEGAMVTDEFSCFEENFTVSLYMDLVKHKRLLGKPRLSRLLSKGQQAGQGRRYTGAGGGSIPKRLLGSKDAVFDMLQDVCDGSPGALQSFAAARIVRALERLGKMRLEAAGVLEEDGQGRKERRQGGD